MVMVLETGLITPPVGLNVFVMGGVSGGMSMNTGDPVPGDGRLYFIAGVINRQ